MKLTHTFYIKRILSSRDIFSLSENLMKYYSFMAVRATQAVQFKNPSLIFI